jgi:hypothetical protein
MSGVRGFSLIWLISILSLCSCTDVRLADLASFEKYQPSFAYGDGDLCLSENQTIMSLQASNLNTVVRGGTLLADSDSDGLPDEEELGLGFDYLLYRSRGVVNDRLCLGLTGQPNCQSVDVQCSGIENALGLNDCDIKAAGLDVLYDHPDQGLDTDKDGIIDLIEIREGGFPASKDDQNDMDGDGIVNREEYFQGTEIRRYDRDLPDRYRTIVEVNKLPDDPHRCAGQIWAVKIKQIPLVGTELYNDPRDQVRPGLKFSHPVRGNVILITFKTRPIVGEGNGQIWYSYQTVTHSPENIYQGLQFGQTDFHLAGEVLP